MMLRGYYFQGPVYILAVSNEKIVLMILYTIFRFWSTHSNEEMYTLVTDLKYER